jgi:hypothetical protein
VVGASIANALLLDFETVPGGAASVQGDSASTAYNSLGLTFSGGGTAGQPVFRHGSSLNVSGVTSPPDMFITTQDRTGGGTFFDIFVELSIPAFSVSADAIINPGSGATMIAFDSLNNVLDSEVIPSGGSSFVAGRFTVSSATQIARVQWLPDNPSFGMGIDNLCVGSCSVPEPGVLWLLVAGIAAGALTARRRSRR